MVEYNLSEYIKAKKFGEGIRNMAFLKMTINKKFILLTLAVGIAFSLFGQKPKPNLKMLTTEDGLSQNTVNALLQDKHGFIWMGTSDGLNMYDGYNFVVYKNDPSDSTSLSNNEVWRLAEDDNGNIWVATYGGGVCKFDPRTETFTRYLRHDPDTSKISYNFIYTIYVDSQNRVWVGHWKGMDLYNPQEDRFEPILLSPKDQPYIYGTYCINEDAENHIWIGTDNAGLKRYNTETKTFDRSFQNDSSSIHSLVSNFVPSFTIDDNAICWLQHGESSITRLDLKTGKAAQLFQMAEDKVFFHGNFIHKDRQGRMLMGSEAKQGVMWFDPDKIDPSETDHRPLKLQGLENYMTLSILEDNSGSIWIGTYSTGVIYLGSNNKLFQYTANIQNPTSATPTESIYEIFEDSKGFLWFGSNNGGLTRMNPKTGEVKLFPELCEALRIEHSQLEVRDIAEDRDGNIWICTLGNGFIRIDPNSFKFKVYYTDYTDSGGEKVAFFDRIIEASDGILWIGTQVGILVAMDPSNGQSTVFRYKDQGGLALPGYYINVLFESLQEELLVGFADKGLFKLNKKDSTFQQVNYEINGTFDTNANRVTGLHQSNETTLWVGTANGLFKRDLQKQVSTLYTTNHGLGNNYISNILEDEQSNLWLSTNSGISKFNPETETFENYTANDGLRQNEFIMGAALKSKSGGRMYFGGTKGYNYFQPDEIKPNTNIPPIAITSFKSYSDAGNFEFVPGIGFKDELLLGYNERDFSIQFTALDFTNPDANEYAFWLEGYNRNWMEIGHKREVTFTNLDPGTYELRLKGSNNDGVWNEMGRTIKITILSPCWLTWWAYMLYSMLGLTLVYGVYRYRVNQLESLRLKELDDLKTKLYTNITHEFRTPLTVISGINEYLKDHFDGQQLEKFEMIDRSSQGLLYLVNQLLDLRKIESDKAEVNYILNNIIPYIRYIAESFSSYASTTDVQVHFISSVESVEMDYDPNKVLIVLSNLLSNAIKYTASGGNVYLQIDRLDQQLQIRVTDSGVGISPSELPHIFDRFYTKEKESARHMDGMGIGLALTKEVIKLLGGSITASSNPGEGSVFTILLPIHQKATNTAPADDESVKSKILQHLPPKPDQDIASDVSAQSTGLRRLLIIEDSEDIVKYLSSALQDQWHIEVASDGRSGVEKALEITPDIILCDLIMPVMDGYAVLDSLKKDHRTSHTPVVLLTAKGDDESRIEGLKRGADIYLTKPFNKTELQIVLDKLVEQRKALQAQFQAHHTFPSQDGINVKKEDNFIRQLETLVLNNPYTKYSITDLCQDLGMSRTQLHNKVKALTGMSTSIYIRSVRLKRGKYLLESSDKSISEIAYEIGFNDPSYFSRSFTEEYGQTPSAVRQ
ncbi:MAG: two-component regulator propeller domain-containing protein [Bacteroidota bacterium]